MPSKDRQKLIDVLSDPRRHYGSDYMLSWCVKVGHISDPSGGLFTKKDGWDFNEQYDSVLQSFWDSITMFETDAQFVGEGRSNGWLCLYSYKGHRINEQFLLDLQEPPSGVCISNKFCRELLPLIETWDETFAHPTQMAQEGLNQAFIDFLAERSEKEYWEARDVETI